jgi:hypothetical protein
MINKGYELKEDGPRCTDDIATATSPKCYYENNVFERLLRRFSKD